MWRVDGTLFVLILAQGVSQRSVVVPALLAVQLSFQFAVQRVQ